MGVIRISCKWENTQKHGYLTSLRINCESRINLCVTGEINKNVVLLISTFVHSGFIFFPVEERTILHLKTIYSNALTLILIIQLFKANNVN